VSTVSFIRLVYLKYKKNRKQKTKQNVLTFHSFFFVYIINCTISFGSGAILKIVTTNICDSDQHMVRGRTSLPGGHMVLGHEITGEVIETGPGCEFI